MIYLLDTNICIFVAKHHAAVIQRMKAHSPEDLKLSSVTLAEIYYGIEKSNRRTENLSFWERFFEPFEVLDFDTRAAKEYGKIRHLLEQSGQMIGERDCQIASIARVNNLVVVTNNIREFGRVPGLTYEDWTT